jgi:hypothetical protein
MQSTEARSVGIVPDDERSQALHAAVAAKLLVDSNVLVAARQKLDEWMERGGRSAPLWARWREILARTPKEIADFLVSQSEEAAWLRKASPFAGALEPRERWSILRGLRRRASPAP